MHQCPIPLAINHYKLSSLSNISLTLHSIAGQKSGIGLTRLKAKFGKAAFLSVSREESLSLLIQVVGWTQVLWVSDWGSHFLAAVSWGLFPTSKGQRFFASWLPSFLHCHIKQWRFRSFSCLKSPAYSLITFLWFFCLPLLLLKSPCDYIVPTQIIQGSLPILKSTTLIPFSKFFLPCSVIYSYASELGAWASFQGHFSACHAMASLIHAADQLESEQESC